MGKRLTKRNEKVEKDFKAWLLSFEKLAERPVVVSLLIEESKVTFVSSINKKTYLSEEDTTEPDCDSPDVDFKKIRKEPKLNAEFPRYIG